MPDNENALALRARWVLPVSGAPIEDGLVVIEKGKIAHVGPFRSGEGAGGWLALRHFPDGIVCPGLINLHSHLDYSHLRTFDTQSSLLAWIRGLATRAFQWSQAEWLDSALSGAREMALSGISCVADSSFSGQAAHAIAAVGLRGVVGLELFGVNADDASSIWQSWQQRFAAWTGDCSERTQQALQAGRLILTVSPHAPYTVAPPLWRLASDWASAKGLPVLAHVSESEAECRFIGSDDEELCAFLVEMVPGGVKGGTGSLRWRGQGLTPVEHLDRHGLLNSLTLAAHAVQLRADDIETLRARGVSVAHCPRSNARLRCGIAPFPDMVDCGLVCGLGTDSAASTDSLDILAEARFAMGLHRAVRPDWNFTAEQALWHVTLGAAAALNMQSITGSIEPGKQADIAVFSVNRPAAYSWGNPYDLVVYGSAALDTLIVDGRIVVEEGQLAA